MLKETGLGNTDSALPAKTINLRHPCSHLILAQSLLGFYTYLNQALKE